MKTWLSAALALALAACAPADPSIEVSEAWVRPPNPATGVTAGYFILANAGGPDRLVGARAETASTAEIHESRIEDGMMRMGRLAEGAPVPRGQTRFEPGGLHLMIFDLQAQPGDTVRITLDFERAPDRAVDFIVRAP